MTERLLPFQPSLGGATGTRVDTAARHNQQCRVSYDDMLSFLQFPEDDMELQRNKYRYCIHKDELVLGIGRPWKEGVGRKRVNNAYPRVISNLGSIGDGWDKSKTFVKMLKFYYHNAWTTDHKQRMIEAFSDMQSTGFAREGRTEDYLALSEQNAVNHWLRTACDYVPMGYAQTLGWVHPKTGDTMCTVMIGGCHTVQNGDFEVFTGDRLQWYWPFEKDCFDNRGVRMNGRDKVTFDDVKNVDPTQHKSVRSMEPIAAETMREKFFERQYGQSGDKKKMCARIKPYMLPFTGVTHEGDGERVFAIALCCARPHEPVDIKISRQSL